MTRPVSETNKRERPNRSPIRTVDETAEQLGVKPTTVRAKVLRREIEFLKIGRCVRITQDEIDRILAESVVPRREA